MLLVNLLCVLYDINLILHQCIGVAHKVESLDFILDPGNLVKRQKDINKSRKMARKVVDLDIELHCVKCSFS